MQDFAVSLEVLDTFLKLCEGMYEVGCGYVMKFLFHIFFDLFFSGA